MYEPPTVATATEDGEYIPKPDSVGIYLDLSLSSRNC